MLAVRKHSSTGLTTGFNKWLGTANQPLLPLSLLEVTVDAKAVIFDYD